MPKPLRNKPGKPHPSFPLTAHPNGQWCKRISDKVGFFGVWTDLDAARANHLRAAADLHAGRRHASLSSGELAVKEMGHEFLAYQMERPSPGQISARWFGDTWCVVWVRSRRRTMFQAKARASAAHLDRAGHLVERGDWVSAAQSSQQNVSEVPG